jgi:hypothetical protein
MGVAMVLMATPATAGLVPPVAGAVAFGVAVAGWLAVLVVARVRAEPLGSVIGLDRCTAHPTHLLLVDAAMLVMYLAMVPAAAPTATESIPGMPGMEMSGTPMSGGEHAGHAATSPTLLVVAALLALYLVVHAVATIVVVVRRARGGAPETAAAPPVGVLGASVGTAGDDASEGGVAVAAPAVPRAVGVLAHGPVQLIGQAGMSLAMAAMLFLLGG